MARKTRQVETRLTAEYIKQYYSEFPSILGQPLGVVPTSLMEQEGYQRALGIMRPFRPEADALVILPRHLLLIEAKVWHVINGLAKLPMYKSLVPVTPELREYMPREVLMELVVGWTSPNLEIMARDHGIAVKVFCPDWLTKVVQGMHHYWTKEYREERERKLGLREYFGVE